MADEPEKIATDEAIKEIEGNDLEKLKAENARLKEANEKAARLLRDRFLNGENTNRSEADEDSDEEFTELVKRALSILRGEKREEE